MKGENYIVHLSTKKAFDLVCRNGIWFKLLNYKLSSKFVNMLKTMYHSVKICVRANGTLTQHFDSYMGVKQRESYLPYFSYYL